MNGPTIQDWGDYYRGGGRPETALPQLLASLDRDDPVWIRLLDEAELSDQIAALAARVDAAGGTAEDLPLYGVPFAIKDNIDVAGLPTSAGCPAYAYTGEATAPAVERLLAAGAILIGKTNLDQFATGLVGTRSPYGPVRNSFDPDYICGGSSSGSASAVARGLVPFALGTDTAGSGRVPAGFNNIVGLKPTRGAVSSRGVVPACRSLDCLSVFALTVDDAARVHGLLAGFDPDDPFSRPVPAARAHAPAPADLRLGVPAAPRWFGDARAEAAFGEAVEAWRALGADIRPLDFTPLHDLAALLYQGPWIAERYAAVGEFIESHRDAVDPVVAGIIEGGRDRSAVEVFRAEYRRAALLREGQRLLAEVDALLVPTTPTIYTVAEIADDPVGLNTHLGTYTNFVNLLDGCALALPGGFRDDGLPAGVTLIAPAWHDDKLAGIGRAWQSAQRWPLGATGQRAATADTPPAAPPEPGVVRLAVVGAHLRGMPLNHELTERDAVFVERTATAGDYRLLALPGTTPPKPGLVRGDSGAEIEVELWDMPETAFGSFVAGIPSPLGIGTLTLDDQRQVKGFICEGWAAEAARDITSFGGWRAFMASEGDAPNG